MEELTLEQRIVAEQNAALETGNNGSNEQVAGVENTIEPTTTPQEVIEPQEVQVQEPVVETKEIVQEPVVQEPVVEKESPFYNETVKKIDEMLRQGIPLNKKTFEYQSLDFDAVDLNDVKNAMDVIERELSDVQNYSEDEVEYLLNSEYSALYRGIDENSDEDEIKEYNDQVMKARINAKKVLGNLKEYQKKVLLPSETPKSNQPTAEQVEAYKRELAAYQQEAKQAIDSFKVFEVKVADDLVLKMDVDDKSVGYAKELALNPEKQNTYFPDRYFKDGKRDIAKMVRDVYILENFDTILKESLIQQRALGEEKILKEEGIAPSIRDKGAASASSTSLNALEQWKQTQARLGL